MRKAFHHRIYLTNGQPRILNTMLEECRWVYNQTLAARRDAYEQGVSLSWYDTKALLPTWKVERPSLKLVHSQVLQNVTQRVDLAFQAFFRRAREGAAEVGYPRFKGFGRYDSITYPQYENGVRIDGDDLILSKLVQYTCAKAADAGRTVVLVNPRNTSKMCSRCGEVVHKQLSDRTHTCPFCGLEMDRDQNAAINILRLGLQSLEAQRL